MRTNQLVSIITPTYNHEKYINHCIESVINQTYSNWEMLIINDASTDQTLSIVKYYQRKDNRIRLINHKTNWGIKRLKDSYNQALKQAKGDFIAILEGDDFWPREKLAKQIKEFTNKKVVLSYGDWVLVSNSGKKLYTRNYEKFTKNLLNNNPPLGVLNLFLTLQFSIGSQTVMIRKSALEKIGGFKGSKHYPFVDVPTYLSLALEGKFAYLPETLGYYRRTTASSWFSFTQCSLTMGRENIQKCVNSFVKDKTPNFWRNLDLNKLKKTQTKYLFKRKLLYPASFLFNLLASKI